jgi:tetratricopeptide (TPR) repeat protein
MESAAPTRSPHKMSAGHQTADAKTMRPTLGVIAAILIAIAALTALDLSLEKTQQAELENSARRFYVDGSRLLKEGKTEQGVDLLRRAHALARENPDYELELINALMAAGKTEEAEPLIADILQRQPNDGRANLTAARLSVKEGNTADAEAYYHRAIYGVWPDNSGSANDGHQGTRYRVSARMELIGLLMQKGKKQELLAELLPLEEDAGNDSAIEKNLGHLFLVAGSPSRAADVYRSLIQRNSRDAEAYAGLGEAELEQGRYREARNALNAAAIHKPHDTLLRRRMQLANTVSALDPTPRQLSSAEKYQRGLRILGLTRTSLERCVGNHPGASPNEADELLKASQEQLSRKAPAHVSNELAEETLELAERIWQARTKTCGTSTPGDEEPLRLIMERLAR